tara:strand:- start:800 stop:1957 length:1158 start_codon:yes stop_codon:yes gene_type:complete
LKNLYKFLTIVLFVVFFLIIDSIFTKFNPLNQENLKQENIEKIRIKNPIFHHTFSPNVNIIEDNGYWGKSKFVTNSLGFKDKINRQISLKLKNEYKKRVIFIGDSFTEGVLLDYEDSFVGIIDANFQKKKVQVLNAGVASYSPSIYYRKIKFYLEKGLDFQDVIVFIDVSDVHDEAEQYEYDEEKDIVLSKNRKTKETTKEKFVSFIKKNFVGSYIILNFIHDFTNLVFSLSKKNEFISEKDKFKTNDEYIRHQASDKYKRDQWTVNQDIYFEYEDGVKKSIHFMSKLNEICNKHNINLTIAVYPMFTQVYHNDTVSIQEKIWKDFSKKKNINFINYFPVFIKKDRNLNERINVIKKFYIPFDLHWNKLGNKVAADYFIKNYKLD